MIDDAVLAAIARAVDQGGDIELALDALRQVDPLVRAAARRRLRDAHADALLATRRRQGPECAAHALRLAYLLVARALPPRAQRDDAAAIEAAFEAARAAHPAPRAALWWRTALLALAVVAAAGTSAVTVARGASRPPPPASPPAPTASEGPPPPVSGAFAEGGVPAPTPGDAAVARALGKDAPDFLIALDHRAEARSGRGPQGMPAEMKEARERALSPEVREALGAGAAGALEALLAAASAAGGAGDGLDGGAAGGPTPRPPAEASDDALARAASRLDDELAARGLGYFVDGDVLTDTESGRRLVLVYTFRVTRVSLFSAGTVTIRALHLRRLDRLNWSHTLLGFSRPTLRSAAVLLDQLDEQVLDLVAPALAPGAPVPLLDPEAPGEERAAVEARAGELVRAEYGALPGLDQGAAVKLGKLLGKRRALFAGWKKLAEAQGMTLVTPTKLRMPEGFARSLQGLAAPDELEDLRLVDAALEDRTREDAFVALREALASSVERHEVQHRLDAAGPQPPPMPAALAARVGPLAEDGVERRHAAAARAELSAYLAELARDARTPRVGLTLLSRFLFDRRMHGTPECYAALTIFEGLRDRLGVRTQGEMLPGSGDSRRIDHRAVAEAYLALAALPPERLRAAARALWEALFSAPLPELRKVAPAGDPPE